jgi:carboxymethylenebutenolidase
MRIELPSGGPAELAVPEGREPTLGLAVCPDIGGLRPLFVDIGQRLADEHGWAVCTIDPFFGRESEPVEQRMKSPLREHLVDEVLAAADATGCDRTAVIGFCLGGMVAYQAAALGRFDRAVGFYGMIHVPEQWRSADMVEPLKALAEPDASSTLAICAGKDHYTPPNFIDELRAVGDHVEVVVYPEADHGFVHDPDRPSHRPDDAADAWRRMAEFVNQA